jgi:hypothetical protein
MTAPT